MVKFSATSDGVTMIGLGLEAENIRRLKLGQPIRVKLSDLGFVGAVGMVQIVIFTGENAETMRRDLAPMIRPDTVVHEIQPPKGEQ